MRVRRGDLQDVFLGSNQVKGLGAFTIPKLGTLEVSGLIRRK